jgi:DNA-binding LacI/PurR family transcriptional regulator
MNKRATIKDVAAEARVSPATISYVLNNKESISAETRERVLRAIEKLNYVPNLSARGLVVKSSRLIGVVIPQTEDSSMLMFNNPFYSEIIGSIEYHARVSGYHVLISGTNADDSYLKLASERNLDGIIIIGMYADEFYSELKKTNIPIVLVDSYCEDHHFHSVQINDRYGAYIATKHLLDCGHRDIALIAGELKQNGVVEMRYRGYCDALKEYGIPLREQLVFAGQVDFKSGMAQGERIAKSGLKPTAAFAAADIMAIGAIKRLSQLGIHVPEDISIIGFDDINLSQYINPGLTTVKQDIQKKGETAVKIILNGIANSQAGKQEIILPLEIVVRESVRKIG